ncbi:MULTISPECIES: PepSY domain-containing protein [Luteimonas]|uniref:PepSY domain-containing protein n=1 Tax=Luteimonas TaxID=83614 RepID=UPI000C7A3EFC|nr:MULTISPECIES: PepSY domain-containing protein [Luteimonas]
MSRLHTTLLVAAIAASAIAIPVAFAQDAATARGQADRQHAAAAAKADPRTPRNDASLDAILADAQRRHPGQVTEVSYDDGEYDIEIRQRDGRSVDLEYSAQTGRLLDTDLD